MPRLTLENMLELGWTWRGPTRERSDEGEHFELRIAELPDFFLAAESYADLVREIKPALRAYLLTYLERGQEPPLPRLDRWQFVGEGAAATRGVEQSKTGPTPRALATA